MSTAKSQQVSRDRSFFFLASGLWVAFTIVVVVARLHQQPSSGNVVHIYLEAAERWRSAEGLYNGSFLYLPTSAVGFLPLTELPFAVSGALWRTINLLLFALGTWSLVALGPARRAGVSFLIVSLFTILLSWSAARHGQLTLAMGGLMMMSAAAMARERGWRAAIYLALAVAAKPLAIVMVPIAFFVMRGMLPKLAVTLTAILLIPFALQDPSYVMSQYSGIPTMLERHAGNADVRPFPQAIWLMRLGGFGLSSAGETLLRGCFAVITWMLCMQVIRGLGPRAAAPYVLTFVGSYILLFLPCTESNTYALMAPSLGWLAARARLEGFKVTWRVLLLAGALCLASHTLLRAYPNSLLSMAKPLACVLLLTAATRRASRDISDVA